MDGRDVTSGVTVTFDGIFAPQEPVLLRSPGILSGPGRPAVVTDAFSAALGLGILLIDLHP